jgi:hypothetical protein
MELPPDGLAVCAQTGAANASAATTATPVNKRCFMSAILSLGPQLDMVGRLAWLPFGRNPLLYASNGIRNGFWESAAIVDRCTVRAPVGLLCYSVTGSAGATGIPATTTHSTDPSFLETQFGSSFRLAK